MGGSATKFFERSPNRVSFGFSSYVAGFSLIWVLWSVLSGAGTYTNVEYGFSLLAALGAAGCLGYLAAYAYRGPKHLSFVFSLFGGAGSLEAPLPNSALVESADWPLLVVLLFGPLSILLAGLGGWV